MKLREVQKLLEARVLGGEDRILLWQRYDERCFGLYQKQHAAMYRFNQYAGGTHCRYDGAEWISFRAR